MAGAVEWVFRMVDRVSGPARDAQKRLELVEKTTRRIDQALRVSGGAFGGWARQGESAARRVESAYARVEARIGATRTGLQSLQGVLMGTGLVVGGLGYGAARVGGAVLGGMSQREGSLMSLQTLLKDQTPQQVRQSAAWIGNFADVTPFEDNQVMDSVKQLLAYKFTFPQVQGISRITGDAASALGSNPADAAQRWEVINRALGQIRSKGRIQGDELLQLQEAGIGTDAYLKKYVGANYRDLMEKGQLGANAGISAILRGLEEDFGGSMDRMSKTYGGLLSTLRSRPQRLLGNMFDSGALEQPRKFLENLVTLTDFSKEPGKRILTRLTGIGKRIVDGIFGPLAGATGAEQGAATVDRLLDKLDEYATWWERNGPAVIANVRGFGEGLRGAADAVAFFLRPIGWLLDMLGRVGNALDRLFGGNGERFGQEGGLGRILGFGAGLAAMAWLGNLLSFGLLGKLGGMAGQTLIGAMKAGAGRAAQGLLTRGLVGEVLTNPLGRRAGLRAALPGLRGRAGTLARTVGTRAAGVARAAPGLLARVPALAGRLGGFLGRIPAVAARIGGLFARFAPLLARFVPWIARAGALFLGLSNPVGWVVTAVTVLVGLGTVLYRRWAPFRDLVDRVADRVRAFFRGIPDALRSLGGGSLLMGLLSVGSLGFLTTRLLGRLSAPLRSVGTRLGGTLAGGLRGAFSRGLGRLPRIPTVRLPRLAALRVPGVRLPRFSMPRLPRLTLPRPATVRASAGRVVTGVRQGAQTLLGRGVTLARAAAGRLPALFARLGSVGGRVLGRIGALLARFAPIVARFLPWIARIGGLFAGLSNPIGWVITAVTAIVSLGRLLYDRWAPFRAFVDRIGDGFRTAAQTAVDWFRSIPEQLAGLGMRLYETLLPEWLRDGLALIGIRFDAVPELPQAPTLVQPPAAPIMRPPTPVTTPTVAARTLTPTMQRSAQALTGVAQRIGIDPNALLAVAMKESALNPAAVNPDSGASGLIQFLPSTARALGTTVEALRRMTPEQQAPFVEAYLRQAGVRQGSSLDQVYSAVFAGNASKAGRTLYTTADGRAYSDNQGLDLNRDGRITSAEAAQSAANAWQPYAGAFQPQIQVHLHGPATPEAVQDIGAAALQGTHQALSTFALEQGAGGTPA